LPLKNAETAQRSDRKSQQQLSYVSISSRDQKNYDSARFAWLLMSNDEEVGISRRTRERGKKIHKKKKIPKRLRNPAKENRVIGIKAHNVEIIVEIARVEPVES
jgi:hypothetical protein